ncbi:MAG: acetyl-CoA carboxylase biotin carboxyl carrier protein subunit, partial [Bacteroidetes bacterium]|nr:acetyl-CoA carboxylase biotin carboxyl carrier protein subunit [Bacteroidota bacterium]
GLVKDIQVEVEDEVSEGQSLLVLEAMKMENIIKSPVNGHIKSIDVKKDTAVDKGQVLIKFK